ncbi:hypothetical protein PLICRDRAFT_174434 [Plicaturopsis crispa FD-325 SS-3]|nr:hypothetical protein PLICRDRAFT_174434 [Plicaturopsis crispa FD-325 SS-3]
MSFICSFLGQRRLYPEAGGTHVSPSCFIRAGDVEELLPTTASLPLTSVPTPAALLANPAANSRDSAAAATFNLPPLTNPVLHAAASTLSALPSPSFSILDIDKPLERPFTLWSQPWSPPVAPSCYTITTLTHRVYADATRGTTDARLELRRADTAALAVALDEKIGQAIEAGDFTTVLTPRRTFFMRVTFPVPVTVFVLLDQVSNATLQTIFPLTGGWRNPACRLATKKCGAYCALFQIQKLASSPFGPAMFQWIVHGFDINALHEQFVGEWHPTLRRTIHDWLATGPGGDLNPFAAHLATYHDLEPAALRGLDTDSHAAFASQMLYRAVPKMFEGGSEAFFSLLWTSNMTGYTVISSHLDFPSPVPSIVARLASLQDCLPQTLAPTFERFLSGSGLPCPSLFAAIEGSFNQLIDLSRVGSPSFRTQMFAWAATGSHLLEQTADPITIILVLDHDPLYATGFRDPTLMASRGNISFKTCSHEVHIPATNLFDLAGRVYSGDEEPASLDDAINHWLLVETLNAIGGHTMLQAIFC